MKEFKGTKGKWNSVVQNRVVKILSEENILIAECDEKDLSYVCPVPYAIHANAKLIAAAPDLLEALMEAKKELEYHNWSNTKTYNQIVQAINKSL